MPVLADIFVTVESADPRTFVSVLAEEHVVEPDAILSFDEAVTFDNGLWYAVMAVCRSFMPELTFDGETFHATVTGKVQIVEAMTPGQFRTLSFDVVGPLWGIPTVGVPTVFNDPTAPAPPAPPVYPSPQSWGNKDVNVSVWLGRNRCDMRELRLFQGLTLHKDTKGDVPVTGVIHGVDESLRFANVPICYELGPFSGKTRGEIVREVAIAAGVPNERIFVPMGSKVNKPVLLSNASLLPFVAEFGLPENWYPYFDEFGNFRVIDVEMKPIGKPDHTLDMAAGDYHYNLIEETPPDLPASSLYITATFPVVIDPTKPDIVTTKTVDALISLYNPLCQKDNVPSHLQSDGQYRLLIGQVLMLVSRITTEVSLLNGVEFKRSVVVEGMYNPLAADPNFVPFPATADYTDAYGDLTTHRDAVESLMETQRETTDSYVDTNGTLQKQVITTMGWLAPTAAMPYRPDLLGDVQTRPGQFVYAGPSARTQNVETYQMVTRITKTYTYSPDGTLDEVDQSTESWYAPESRCDITTEFGPPTPVPTPAPVNPVPPKVAPPPKLPVPKKPVPPAGSAAPWAVALTGPTKIVDTSTFFARVMPVCTFHVDWHGAPAGATTAWINVYMVSGHIGTTLFDQTRVQQVSAANAAGDFVTDVVVTVPTPSQSAPYTLKRVYAIATVSTGGNAVDSNVLDFWPFKAVTQPPAIGSDGSGGSNFGVGKGGSGGGTAGAQLVLTKTMTENPRGTLTFYFAYRNIGLGIAQACILKDTIGPHQTYNAGSADNGGTYSAGVVTWNLGDLAPGASGSVSMSCLSLYSPAGTFIGDTAKLTSDTAPTVSSSINLIERGTP